MTSDGVTLVSSLIKTGKIYEELVNGNERKRELRCDETYCQYIREIIVYKEPKVAGYCSIENIIVLT
jgi:hypothetical protein